MRGAEEPGSREAEDREAETGCAGRVNELPKTQTDRSPGEGRKGDVVGGSRNHTVGNVEGRGEKVRKGDETQGAS